MEDTFFGDNANVIYVLSSSLPKYQTAVNWSKWKTKYKALQNDDPPSKDENIIFKDPVVKAVCVENWDLNGDGELSMYEASKVWNLGMAFKKGLEDHVI